jgi:hypothetical protein
MYGSPINKTDELELRRILFGLTENVAKENNFTKICLEVHTNLRLYEAYNLKRLGYNITNQIAKDNSFWIVTEKYLS